MISVPAVHATRLLPNIVPLLSFANYQVPALLQFTLWHFNFPQKIGLTKPRPCTN